MAGCYAIHSLAQKSSPSFKGGSQRFALPYSQLTCFSRGPFAWGIAFNQMHFITANADAFLMRSAMQWFIYSRHPMALLGSHSELGAHTDVLIFYPQKKTERYVWSHPALRPFGEATPLQCPNTHCMSLRPFREPHVICNKKKTQVLSITLTCSRCNMSKVYEMPPSFQQWGKGEITKSEHGEWYRELEV